jgi:GT2 family glycosyltransferase
MLKHNSFVSIVIVNYNGFEYLSKCVASLLRSDYPFYEIIIVDNGSTDGSVSRIQREFEEHKNRIVILDLSNNVGFAIGNWIGAKQAVGEYILLVNSDTKVKPSCLSELVSVMDRDPSIGVAQPKILLMDKPDTFDCAGGTMSAFGVIHMRGVNEKDIGQYDRMEEISFAKGAAMIIRKKLWISLGGFDPLFFVYSEETDFCWRIWLSGYRVVFVPSGIVYHVGAGTSKKFGSYFARVLLFQYYRNRIVTVTKNLSLKNLIKYAPGLFGINLIQAALHISRNEPMSMLSNLRGIAWCLLFFNKLWIKRLTIQRRRVVKDNDLFDRGVISKRVWL